MGSVWKPRSLTIDISLPITALLCVILSCNDACLHHATPPVCLRPPIPRRTLSPRRQRRRPRRMLYEGRRHHAPHQLIRARARGRRRHCRRSFLFIHNEPTIHPRRPAPTAPTHTGQLLDDDPALDAGRMDVVPMLRTTTPLGPRILIHLQLVHVTPHSHLLPRASPSLNQTRSLPLLHSKSLHPTAYCLYTFLPLISPSCAPAL